MAKKMVVGRRHTLAGLEGKLERGQAIPAPRTLAVETVGCLETHEDLHKPPDYFSDIESGDEEEEEGTEADEELETTC